jgi:hypothetical protein
MPFFRIPFSATALLLILLCTAGTLSAQTDTLRQQTRRGKTVSPVQRPDSTQPKPLGALPTIGDTLSRIPAIGGIGLDTPAAPPRAPRRHSPMRAAILSATVPGAGQIYNRKYWKAPIAWAIIGGTGYWMFSSRQDYRYWRFQYLYRVDSNPLTVDENPSIPTSTLKAQRDQAHTTHEWSIIAFTVGYLLTVTDAFVDAHLFDFDVSNDLSFRLVPGQPTWAASPLGLGATLQVNF